MNIASKIKEGLQAEFGDAVIVGKDKFGAIPELKIIVNHNGVDYGCCIAGSLTGFNLNRVSHFLINAFRNRFANPNGIEGDCLNLKEVINGQVVQ